MLCSVELTLSILGFQLNRVSASGRARAVIEGSKWILRTMRQILATGAVE